MSHKLTRKAGVLTRSTGSLFGFGRANEGIPKGFCPTPDGHSERRASAAQQDARLRAALSEAAKAEAKALAPRGRPPFAFCGRRKAEPPRLKTSAWTEGSWEVQARAWVGRSKTASASSGFEVRLKRSPVCPSSLLGPRPPQISEHVVHRVIVFVCVCLYELGLLIEFCCFSRISERQGFQQVGSQSAAPLRDPVHICIICVWLLFIVCMYVYINIYTYTYDMI